MTRLRVLLSEASRLTAREHLTILGTAGVRVEAMSSDPFALCRWSRWARQLHRCPASGKVCSPTALKCSRQSSVTRQA